MTLYQLEHLVYGLAMFALWSWMWCHAERLKKKYNCLVLYLIHIFLAATWVLNVMVGLGVK